MLGIVLDILGRWAHECSCAWLHPPILRLRVAQNLACTGQHHAQLTKSQSLEGDRICVSFNVSDSTTSRRYLATIVHFRINLPIQQWYVVNRTAVISHSLAGCASARVRVEPHAMSLPHATGHPNTYMAQASKNEWTTVLWKYAADCEWGDERAPQLSALVSNPSLCASA